MENNRHTKEKMNELAAVLRTSFRSFKREMSVFIGDKLTNNEYSVLKLLSSPDVKTVTEISRELGVSVSHITNLTDSLVKKELIMRQRSATDRRIVQISLTEKGAKLTNELKKKNAQFLYEKFGQLTPEELNTFIELFKKIQ
ncbi:MULTISPECIES: MarR family transcriptional regulator [Bacillaceae]|uniref:MarR family winged helix-turn-helix transcriptional regulator n=1 Tax=Bacillaceae TaxID=186817 RepID=UPI0016005044|nr:MarR family transcriptional regulator [Bacillus sp. PK3_68]